MSAIGSRGDKEYRRDLARLAEIVRLFLRGIDPPQIARRLKCTSREITDIVERHRLRSVLPKRHKTDENAAKLGDPASCAPVVPARPPLPRTLLRDLGRASAHELSRRYRVSESAVREHQRKAGVHLRKKLERYRWTPRLDQMLGRYSDGQIAQRTGIHVASVAARRRKLDRPALRPTHAIEWTRESVSWLGKRPDRELARLWGLHANTVRKKRRELGLPAYRLPEFVWSTESIVDLFALSVARFREKHAAPWDEIRAKRRELRVPRQPTGSVSKAGFTTEMTKLLGKRPDRKLARSFLLGVKQVRRKRHELGIGDFRASQSPWTAEFLAKLGKVPDAALAEEMGIGLSSVAKRRYKLGIKACTQYFEWTKERLALLGTMPDAELAKKLGLSWRQVIKKRQEHKIPCFDRPKSKWTPERLALLGTMPDPVAARKLKVTVTAARSARIHAGIPAYKGRPQMPKRDKRTSASTGKARR